jgi:hypothetical protein
VDYSAVTYESFLTFLPHIAHQNDWRYGQAVFNLLANVRPHLADSIRTTHLDPFYREKHDIDPMLWTLLESRWDEPITT